MKSFAIDCSHKLFHWLTVEVVFEAIAKFIVTSVRLAHVLDRVTIVVKLGLVVRNATPQPAQPLARKTAEQAVEERHDEVWVLLGRSVPTCTTNQCTLLYIYSSG